MTLALLLTAVTGAWAQSSPKVYTTQVTVDDLQVGDILAQGFSLVNKESEKGFYFDKNRYKLNGSISSDDWHDLISDITSYGENCTISIRSTGHPDNVFTPVDENGNDGNAWVVTKIDNGIPYISGITFELTEWSLTPDADKKVWTLAKMPANNIELQVEYYAESNLFLSKDALADKANISVLNGETAVTFDDAGKSTATVLEGNTVTATIGGTKKVLGMTVAKAAGNTYLKWDTDQKKLVATEIPAEVTTVTSSTTTWAAGTYVVEGEVTINGNITLNGAVDLIIKDGAKLTVNNHIYGGSHYYNLSIYGQSKMNGQLVVNCSDDNAIKNITTLEVHSCNVKATSSDPNKGGFYNIHTFNVYGGSVDGEGTGTDGFGIWLLYNGSINIYGGDVKAVGKGTNPDRYGILGTSTVTVYSGKLWAENADNKALSSVVTLTKGAGFSGKIEYSSDKSTWSETKDTEAKYVRVGY